MKIRRRLTLCWPLMLGAALSLPAQASTELCDRWGMNQGFEVCKADSWGESFFQKQSPAKQAEMMERVRKHAIQSAKNICARQGKAPKFGYGKDATKTVKGEFHFAHMLNTDC